MCTFLKNTIYNYRRKHWQKYVPKESFKIIDGAKAEFAYNVESKEFISYTEEERTALLKAFKVFSKDEFHLESIVWMRYNKYLFNPYTDNNHGLTTEDYRKTLPYAKDCHYLIALLIDYLELSSDYTFYGKYTLQYIEYQLKEIWSIGPSLIPDIQMLIAIYKFWRKLAIYLGKRVSSKNIPLSWA